MAFACIVSTDFYVTRYQEAVEIHVAVTPLTLLLQQRIHDT